MTLADRLAHEGLTCIPVQLAPGVKRWVLCKDPCLVGTREAYCSARVFLRYHDVLWQLGFYVTPRYRNPTPYRRPARRAWDAALDWFAEMTAPERLS